MIYRKYFRGFSAMIVITNNEKRPPASHPLSIQADEKQGIKFAGPTITINKSSIHVCSLYTNSGSPIVRDQSVVGEMVVGHGGTITMSVTAECWPGPPVYQWFKDQRNIIPGQTTKTLLLYNASTNDTGTQHSLDLFKVYSLNNGHFGFRSFLLY